jgi:hypothetical protein
VIYDAAHAFAVEENGDSILNAGDLASLSFHATKTFNTIEGGALVSHDADTRKKIDKLKNFGFAGFSGITLTDVSNGKGEIYNCDVTEIDVDDGDHVTISVATIPKGYLVTPAARTVPVWVKEISFVSLTANGKSTEENTSELALKFNPGFPAILPANVILSDCGTKGEFKDVSAGNGTDYTLKVSNLKVSDGEKATVSINQKPVNCSLNPASRDVQIWRKQVNFSLAADGASLTDTTKNLTLIFDKGLPNLKPENIEVVGCKPGKLAEVPGSAGGKYTVPVSDITVKNGEKITVNVKQDPVDAILVPKSQSVPVYIQDVKFVAALAVLSAKPCKCKSPRISTRIFPKKKVQKLNRKIR